MERYKVRCSDSCVILQIIHRVGDGSFGMVMKAVNIYTGEIVCARGTLHSPEVAIKRIKKEYMSWEESVRLKEVEVCECV